MSGPADSPEVLDRFNSGLVLVPVLARQVGRAVGSTVLLDELESFGREGLLDAARRYDASRGVPFRAYANLRIRGSMLDGVRSTMPLPRRAHERLRGLEAADRVDDCALETTYVPGAAAPEPRQADKALAEHLATMAMAVAMGMVASTGRGQDGELVAIDGAESPEDALGRAELVALVREALDDLPHQEAELVRRHYLEGERFDHVARDLGLSKSWASRLHTRALQRLTKRLGRNN